MTQVIWQCTLCRFRFPGGDDDARAYLCPSCKKGRTVIVRELTPQTNPTHINQPAKRNIIAVLDNIRSIQNVGGIFRSADGAGITHLHLCGITATPTHPKIAKVALGSENSVAWSSHPNALDLVEKIKAKGIPIWALEGGERAQNLMQSVCVAETIALVVGNEVTGVDLEILALADRVVALPMRGVKQSLNVATAFGIAAYYLT